jgi:chemotaxis protein methyltransferase CheR
MIKVTLDEFKVLARYIYEVCGISLDASKVYLIETRLGSLVEELGCTSYSEFYYRAKTEKIRTLERRIVNAITTNETLWFRDKTPFEALQFKVLPDLIDRKRAGGLTGRIPIRIWSAACSTGQEVYTIAMVVREMLPDTTKFDVTILGTDISDEVIAAASYGKYSKFEMDRGLPPDKLRRYFTPDGDGWKVKDELRVLANFRKLNLFESLQGLGRFDVVFCRNVAIYFSIEDRKVLFNKIAETMQPQGYLLIGSSEYLVGISSRFEPQRHCRAVYYQVNSGAAPQPTVPKPAAAPSKNPSTAPPPLIKPPLVPVGAGR